MTKKILLLLLTGLALASCKKREYPPEQNADEGAGIYLEGTAGAEPVSLRIGQDDYYCYSSYQQRTDSVYVFTGELKKYECNSCPNAFRLELSDYRRSLPGSSINPDSSFHTGLRSFAPALTKAQMVGFTPQSNKTVASVRWAASNGMVSSSNNLNTEFTQPGLQTISLTVRTTGNCETIIASKIFVSEEGIFGCDIKVPGTSNNTAEFSAALVGGKPPFKYSWEFGDGGKSNLQSPSHVYPYIGSYPVKLTIEDADHKTCEANYIHVTDKDLSSCSVNMSLLYFGGRPLPPEGVKLQWIDDSNIAFSSDGFDQPANSYFEITSSLHFKPNDQGEPGRLLNVRFNVLLSDGSRKLWFKSDKAAIVVAYK
jgi:hypothetical protein